MRRLQSILAQAGIASRRKSAEFIEAGRVCVDGKIVREKGLSFDESKHIITVDGKQIKKEEKLYFVFNKPAGVITTVKDTHGRKTVSDFFSKFKERLYPVGRLDAGTTGLLIVTNDGDLARELTHPSSGVEKEYIAEVAGDIGSEEIKKLRNGISLEEGTTAPCVVETVEKKGKSTTLRIILHEGKKRQIRRMVESVGCKVVKLERVRVGCISLGPLRPGTFRKLTERELNELMSK